MFAQLVLTALLVRRVHAEVQDLMLSVGSQVMQLGERMGVGPPRTLRVNGAQIRMRVEHAPTLTLDEVLDHFESVCRSRNGRFYEQLSQGRSKVKLEEQELDFLDGVMRVDADDQGSVACLDVGEDERGSPSSILKRAQAFAATGDATSFGQLRYVRAEKEERGVFVVMMWTDGPLNLKQMFPTTGDAPGVDFPDLPRPPHGRRILSAWEEGQAPALNIYQAARMDAASLDAHYRAQLPALGWEAMTPPAANKSHPIKGAMVMRNGVTVLLSHGSLDNGKHGLTTIIPMDTAGATSAAAL
jgi:hypothetical protein